MSSVLVVYFQPHVGQVTPAGHRDCRLRGECAVVEIECQHLSIRAVCGSGGQCAGDDVEDRAVVGVPPVFAHASKPVRAEPDALGLRHTAVIVEAPEFEAASAIFFF